MIQRILVLGGGSAGFLVAIAVKYRLPQLRVLVLRSKDIGIIGVGEGTTIPVVNHLHGYLRIHPAEFHRVAQPTWKLGIRFLWGPRPYFDYALSRQFDARFPGLPKVPGYYCDNVPDFGFISALMTHNRVFPRRPDGLPHITRDPAYHIENEHFVTFLEQYARRLGVEVADDTVVEVKQVPLVVEPRSRRHRRRSRKRVGGEDLTAAAREQGDHNVDAGLGSEHMHRSVPKEHVSAAGVE
jgi:tryptophan 7-halogenase